MSHKAHSTLLVLEDDHRRINEMKRVIEEEALNLELLSFPSAWDCGCYLLDHCREIDAVSLDHDLDKAVMPPGIEPGDGREVARIYRHLSHKPPTLLHTSNLPMSDEMENLLLNAGVKAIRANAYTDLRYQPAQDRDIAWIKVDWLRKVIKALAKNPANMDDRE